jgi:hypothetical protein
MPGEVVPVVIHFGASEARVARMLRGYQGALEDARAWFARRLNGPTFEFRAPAALDATRFGKSLGDFRQDAWGCALGTATEAGFPVWADEQLVTILVDEVPYTQLGLGGASPTPVSGAVVKDGDALEIFAKKHAGERIEAHDYSQNVAMLIHELLHGMHANDHEEVDGPNIEHEWWEGLSADLAPVNRAKLLAGIWVSGAAPAGGNDEAYRRGVRDTLDALQQWLDERRSGLSPAVSLEFPPLRAGN